MEYPLVTVITVTYNSSPYVRKAIESILASSYTNFELIIGDDCSTDSTWSIIKEYRDSRIVCYRNEQNMGEYPNRNKAVGLASGDYIFFIDGDDMIFFRGIEDAVREMLRYPDCKLGIVNTQSLKCVGPIRISKQDAFDLEFFGGGAIDGSLTNNVFHSLFLKENLFFTSYKCSDTFTRLKLLEKTDILFLYSIIGIWRLSKNQASSNLKSSELTKDFLHFFKNHLLSENSFWGKTTQAKLKPLYYRRLLKYLMVNPFNLMFLNKKLREYLLDGFWDAVAFILAKPDRSFWNQYNWDNINIDIVNNNGRSDIERLASHVGTHLSTEEK